MSEEFEGFDESGVKGRLIEWLDDIGWETYGDERKEGCAVLDERYDRSLDEVVYWNLLREKLKEINDEINQGNVDDVITQLRRDLDQDRMMEGNHAFHQDLTKGVQIRVEKNGERETIPVSLIDDEGGDQNSYIAATEFRYRRKESVRPDVVLFVNGIPLVISELKSLVQENDIKDAISDMHEYEEDAPRLFMPALFNLVADTEECRYGAVGAPKKHYYPWNPSEEDVDEEYLDTSSETKRTAYTLLRPSVLLDILDNFVLYQEDGGIQKIVPRHMQYYAANSILERVKEDGDKNGLIWHTQGSGKSFTMLYVAKNLLYRDIIENPQILLIIDRENLRDQMSDDLHDLVDFRRYEIADSIEHLQETIESGISEVVVTTIQMFQGVDADIQENPNTVVLTDEAHRFMEARLGSKLEAALHKGFNHFGFTGTPVNEGTKEGRNTFDYYSEPEDEDSESGYEYLHWYSMQEGIEDDVIKPVRFELRNRGLEWDIDDDVMEEEHGEVVRRENLSPEEENELIRETINSRTLAELRPRVEEIAADIAEHYTQNLEPSGWKGMVVTPSRKAAAIYGEELRNHFSEDEVEVIISSGGQDEPVVRKFHTTSEEKEAIVDSFEGADVSTGKEERDVKILVVCGMLLTGFDAPVLKTIYLDRPLENHNLLQAIARTNRPAEGEGEKRNGLILDYVGVFDDDRLDDALSYYDPEVRDAVAKDAEELLDEFNHKLDELVDLLDGMPDGNDPEELTDRLTMLRESPELKKEFKQMYRDVESLYDTISPHEELEKGEAKDKYAFVNSIYLAFKKSEGEGDGPSEELREKTKEIVEENVDVEMIDEEFEVVEVGEDHLEELEDRDLDPGAAAAEIAHATQQHLQGKDETNPKYRSLSEEVRRVFEEKHKGERSDEEAFERLKELEEEVIETENEADERGFSEAEHALYRALEEEYGEHIEDDEEAEKLTREVYEAFKERVDDSYDGWRTSDATKEEVKDILLDVVAVENGKGNLCKEDGFMKDMHDYLVENHSPE